jgi:hypothetical protein
VEGDWSGAAFWYAMNCLGGEVKVQGLDDKSAQPDKVVCALLKKICEGNGASSLEVDVSECPDLFPVLSVVAAAQRREVVFSGVKRLRYKESNRVSAMAGVLGRLGVATREEETFFKVFGKGEMFRPCELATLSDHRIAMASAVAATFASGEIILDDAACAAKSYPAFFDEFFPTWPHYFDHVYNEEGEIEEIWLDAKYYYRFIEFMDYTYDIYAEWPYLTQEEFDKEVARVTALFESTERAQMEPTQYHGYVKLQKGRWTCLILYSGQEPFVTVDNSYTYEIFAYDPDALRVRYIYCDSLENGADQPYYLQLDWD